VGCTFWDAATAFAVNLNNNIEWTEGAYLNFNQIRGVKTHYKLTIVNPADPLTKSFAETRILNAGGALYLAGETWIDICAEAYLYGGTLDCKVNFERPVDATGDKMVFMKVGAAAVVDAMHFNMYLECAETRPDFIRLQAGANSRITGTGRIRMRSNTAMSLTQGDTHPFDDINSSAAVYLNSNGEFSAGTGDDRDLCILGAGQQISKRLAAGSNAYMNVAYFAQGTYDITLCYRGTGREHTVHGVINATQGMHADSSSKALVLWPSTGLGGTNCIDLSGTKPGLSYSTVKHCPFLFVNIINAVSDGTLDVHLRLRNHVSTAGVNTDYDQFRPAIINPDMSGISLGSVVQTAAIVTVS